MTELTPEKPERSPADRELARLEREVDRTRAEYHAAIGEGRDQCWKLYQRAMTNLNNAVAKTNIGAADNLNERTGT